jgi:hypothetical protein
MPALERLMGSDCLTSPETVACRINRPGRWQAGEVSVPACAKQAKMSAPGHVIVDAAKIVAGQPHAAT